MTAALSSESRGNMLGNRTTTKRWTLPFSRFDISQKDNWNYDSDEKPKKTNLSFSQAWAVFKGKYKEGDKAEPATWKTRLRCALNKSPDFEEVTERSQLDISEPYKVYRIVPEEEQKSEFVWARVLMSAPVWDLTVLTGVH